MFSEILGGLGLAGSLFGGNSGGNPGGSQSGYAAMTPEMKKAWDQYTQQILQGQNTPGAFNAPGFNQFQQNAMNAFGNPNFGPEGLKNYLAPFEGQRQQQMGAANQAFDQGEGRLRGLFGSGQGKGGVSQQGIAGLNDLTGKRANALAGIESNFQQQGLGLQRQSLFDQLQAGNQQYGLAEQNSPYGQLLRQMGLLQGLPQSQNSWGGSQGEPNWLSRLSGAGLALGGNSLGNLFNGGGFGGQNPGVGQYGPANKFTGQYW